MPLYSNFLLYQLSSSGGSGYPVDWDNDTFRCALFASSASSYVMDCSGYTFFAQLAPYEIAAGGGYTASGQVASGMTISFNGHNPTRIKLTGSNVSWGSATITARFAVIYKKDPANHGMRSPLICWVDFGSDQSSTSGTFEIQWNSNGIWEISSPWT